MKTARIAALVATAALGAGIVATATTASAHVTGNKYAQGVSVQTDPKVPLWSTTTTKMIDKMAKSGANTFVITFPLEQDTISSTTIHARPKSNVPRAYTPSDSELTAAIHRARARGMKVVLKPHLELRNGEWRAHIKFSNSQDKQADAWSKSWSRWLQHYAALGQKEHVYALVIGTEQLGTTLNRYNEDNSKRWIKVVKDVRKAGPKVKVTYAAYNTGRKTRPNETMLLDKKFVKTLDWLGMTYYPIRDVDNPTLARLKAHMKPERRGVFDKIHSRYGKDIVVEETGFTNKDGALQGRQYEALLSFLNGVPYVKGVYLYRWSGTPTNAVTFQPKTQALAAQSKWYR